MVNMEDPPVTWRMSVDAGAGSGQGASRKAAAPEPHLDEIDAILSSDQC